MPFPSCRPLTTLWMIFALVLVSTLSLIAQDRFAFSPDISYDPKIPSPATYLGYELGKHYTFHAYITTYFETLATASDRVTLHDYGSSHEGRRLLYLVITSPENHARIEDIRRNNLRLTDPEDNGAEALLAHQPAIHWMSYNVHGNEASSSEAAMQVAYRLSAGQDDETQRFLDSLVVIIDPMINPDGRDRYVYWYRSMMSKHLNTNAENLEHSEPWPGGRTNHYWFDLNRDWVWLVHPESQGRIAAYQHWMPQVHIDYHEQGFNNNYFTHPGTTPRNLNLPTAHATWATKFGTNDAKAFDQYQISYFTGEAFDFFYPGYGSSYPSLMGAIAMLREQGGHSRGGRAVETNDGYILTLRQRIFDHYITSMVALKTTSDNRVGLLRYFRDALNPEKSNKSKTQAYLIPDQPHSLTYDALNVLLKQGVDIERATVGFTVSDAHDYRTGKPSSRSFEAGTFIIRTDQRRHLLINTLMQRQMAIEDSIMYDMATWSIPLAYSLAAAWTERDPSVVTTPVTELLQTPAMVLNPKAGYAYVIDWSQRYAPNALAMLWKAGYNVRSVQRPFGVGEKTFSRGSLVVLMGRNRDKAGTVVQDMQQIAHEAGVEIIGLNSGLTDKGIDLASRRSIPIKQPKVALLVDSPFNSYTAGQLWFLLEEWTQLPINRIRLTDLPNIKLNDYDVLLLPGTRGNLSQSLDSTQVDRIGDWIRAGGTLIATENSALFMTKDQAGLTNIELVKEDEDDKDDKDKPDFEPETLDDPYVGLEQREDLEDLNNIPGSALNAHLDPTHPLAYGMPAHLYSLKFGSAGLEPTIDADVVGYYERNAGTILASGYASLKNREKLAGKAFAMVESKGRGKVVLLLDNTQYRMFWLGPARLIQNAAMLLPGM